MTLSDLAAIGSFVSGIAVVITLIFLLLQMRQNNSQMQMAELNSAQVRFSSFRLAIVNNRDVAQLWFAGLSDGAMDDIDELRFSSLLNDFTWSVFNIWDRHSRGTMSTDVPSAIPFLATMASSKRGNNSWKQTQGSFPQSFILAVDEAIVSVQKGAAPSH